MKNKHYLCSAAIGSVSEALAAQRVLSTSAIPTEVINYDRAHSSRGCIYGISFGCAWENNVRAALGAARIDVKEYSRL